MRYGGNTTCFCVNAGGRQIIIDAGTGLFNVPVDEDVSTLLLSHIHWDHIAGLSMTPVFHNPNAHITIYGGEHEEISTQEWLESTIAPPLFPVDMRDFSADVVCKTTTPHFVLYDNVTVTTFETEHPNGCNGYRLDYDGRSIAFLIDHEHGGKNVDNFVRECDLLVYDGHYVNGGYCKGWGHSTPQEGLAMAQRLGIKQIAFSHYAPNCTDEIIDKAAAELIQSNRSNTNIIFVSEGMKICL